MGDRGDFAALLRAWRDRLQPAAVGLPSGRRRTPGLRREEIAMLAGLSVDYVVRLEQGRADRPSSQVVAALARVLQLSDLERDQFFLSAGLPAPLPSLVPTHIPASVQRLLARMPEVALAVYTTTWTQLSANDAWRALLGHVDLSRNLIELQFTGSGAVVVRSEAESARFERALVSDLRTAQIRYPDDPSIRSLVSRLSKIPRFTTMWSASEIIEHTSGSKSFVHPAVGTVTLDCDVFTAIGSDLRVVAYTAAPGSQDASRFDLIRTLGASTPSPAAR